MGLVVDVESLEWQPVRPNVAHGVYGKTLLADGVKVVLTRVVPGGEFALHRDAYGHLFYFLGGAGTVQIGEDRFQVRSGLATRVASGEVHAYENTGTEEMILISVNVPDRGRE